jgi:hypothetical protein
MEADDATPEKGEVSADIVNAVSRLRPGLIVTALKKLGFRELMYTF